MKAALGIGATTSIFTLVSEVLLKPVPVPARKIGLRMALGADHRHVLGLILRGAMSLIALGLVIGVPLTLLANRFLGAQLYGVNPYDPRIIAVAVSVLGLSALIAAVIPAPCASAISPLLALRAE